jgi:hypothetical protein
MAQVFRDVYEAAAVVLRASAAIARREYAVKVVA